MFTKAIEWGKVKDNTAKKVGLLKGEVERIRYFMRKKIHKLLLKAMNGIDIFPI
jgi:hypothetical protein